MEIEKYWLRVPNYGSSAHTPECDDLRKLSTLCHRVICLNSMELIVVPTPTCLYCMWLPELDYDPGRDILNHVLARQIKSRLFRNGAQ
jgi:hypothetical protein